MTYLEDLHLKIRKYLFWLLFSCFQHATYSSLWRFHLVYFYSLNCKCTFTRLQFVGNLFSFSGGSTLQRGFFFARDNHWFRKSVFLNLGILQHADNTNLNPLTGMYYRSMITFLRGFLFSYTHRIQFSVWLVRFFSSTFTETGAF